MERSYENVETTSSVSVFIGKEVESSAAFGLSTLFLVPGELTSEEMIEEILAHAHEVDHVYLNANHVDVIETGFDIIEVMRCVESSSIPYMTLEVFSWSSELINLLDEFPKLLFNISIQIPYIETYSKRIALKIDDTDFENSNIGVWTSTVSSLLDMDPMKFTPWTAYTQDKIIK